jgi:hypothetical protein
MNFSPNIATSITPAKAQKLLAEHGMLVSLEQAAVILEFLLKLATSTQTHEVSHSIHPRQHRRAS